MGNDERRALLTAVVTYLTYLLGGSDTSIQVLIVLVVTDYITGMLKAIVNKSLNSYIGWRGLIKKTGVFISLIVAVQIEILINQRELLHNAIAVAFVVNEGISILENLIDIGVPVPQKLVKYLENMRDKEENL